MTGFSRYIRTICRRFGRDREGVAAIEFALIAPIMLALYMASVEFQDYFTMDRKLTALNSAAADVVSQDDVITNSEMTDIFSAITSMMAPYDGTSLRMRVTRVDVDGNGQATVGWSDGRNITGYAVGSTYPLPASLATNNTSYIVSESSYTYTAIIGELLPSGITLNRKYYVNPRYVDQVQRDRS